MAKDTVLIHMMRETMNSSVSGETADVMRVQARKVTIVGIGDAARAKVELEEAITALLAFYNECTGLTAEITGHEIDGRVIVAVGL